MGCTSQRKKLGGTPANFAYHVSQYGLQSQVKDEIVAFLQMHNLGIETYENKSAAMQAGAIDHIALDIKNIDTLFEVVKSKHFYLLDDKVNSLPFWDNGVKFFTILGPNKEKIEFCERI